MGLKFVGIVSCDYFNGEVPHCPHGPMLCWQYDAGRRCRRFYSCAACRSRRQCRFWLSADSPLTQPQKQRWKREVVAETLPDDHLARYNAAQQVVKKRDARFCRDCSSLVTDSEVEPAHQGHCLLHLFGPNSEVKPPDQLLSSITVNKCEAQFLFTGEVVEQLCHVISGTGVLGVLSIAASSIHHSLTSGVHTLPSFMLDIDCRYEMFYPPESMATYNLFNHHFFSHTGKQNYEKFIKSHGGNVAVILDPPFGGRLEPLALTLASIAEDVGCSLVAETEKRLMPVFITLPYFLERNLIRALPGFHMTDVRIDYTNHRKLSSTECGGRRRLGSAVRLFTNLPPASVRPAGKQYRLCPPCHRWVHVSNRHCSHCNACTSKDGGEYQHCLKCARCVKSSWRHCDKCGRCSLPQHPPCTDTDSSLKPSRKRKNRSK